MGFRSVFPHGRRSVFVLLASLVAYFLNGSSAGTCYYMEVDSLDGPLLSFDPVWVGPAGHNLDNSWCDPWSDTERQFYFDSAMDTGFGMASASGLLALICAIGACVLSCATCETCCLKCLGVSFIVEGIFCLLSLIVLSSEFCDKYNCTFGIGAGLTIPAAIAAGVAGGFFITTPPYVDAESGVIATPVIASTSAVQEAVTDAPPGSVQVVQEYLPDGSKKTIRTTVNTDGSMTVQETIETPV